MDRILVRDLELACVVGINPHERNRRQRLVVNLVLDVDLSAAAASDRIEDTVDYKVLKDRILATIPHRRFDLIETVAGVIADLALADPRVATVKVTVDKPGALTGARSVAVELNRAR